MQHFIRFEILVGCGVRDLEGAWFEIRGSRFEMRNGLKKLAIFVGLGI